MKIIGKIFGIILILGIVVVLLIQLIPYSRNHTNPPVVEEPNWDSQQTRDLAVRACFDCHSNEVIWPWYSNIAPISWLVQRDADEGRQVLNFSDWRNHPPEEADELGEVIAEGEMPPSQYLLLHAQARLTSGEKDQLISGLYATKRNR